MNKEQLVMAMGRLVLADGVRTSDAINASVQTAIFVALEGRVPRELFMKVVEETWDLGVQAMDRIENEMTMEA